MMKRKANAPWFNIDAIIKMIKSPGESELELLRRVRIIFQTGLKNSYERECLSIYFGKLPSNLKDRILEWKDVEDLSFVELVRLLKTKERDAEFKGLEDMRS